MNAQQIVETVDVPDGVQVALATQGRFVDALSRRTDLADAAFDVLYARTDNRKKPSADVACNLAGRPLDPDRYKFVLQTEKRTTPLLAAVEHNGLDADVGSLLADRSKVPTKVANLAATDPAVTLEDRRTLLNHADALVRLRTFAFAIESDRNPDPLQLSDAEAAEAFRSFADWVPTKSYKERSHLCRGLLALRPALLEVAVADGQHEVLVCAAAGMPNLVDPDLQRQVVEGRNTTLHYEYALMAFAANPVVDPALVDEYLSPLATKQPTSKLAETVNRRLSDDDPLHITCAPNQVTDGDELTKLLRRALPSRYREDGRPWHALLLADNPNLDVDDAQRIAGTLARSQRNGQMPDFVAARVYDMFAGRYPTFEQPTVGNPARRTATSTSSNHQPTLPDRDDILNRRVSRMSSFALRGNRTPVMQVLSDVVVDHLGSDPVRWNFLLELADSGFDGTVEQLLQATDAMAA